MAKICIVIPNWNGKKYLEKCLESLKEQTLTASIIVVDNGSKDGSTAFLHNKFPDVGLVSHDTNLGFAGGVNSGMRKAMAECVDYIALLNNDAVADSEWVKNLSEYIIKNPHVGIATSKITDFGGKHLDTTGEFYTIWGLSFSRGRDEDANTASKYDRLHNSSIFGACGGASIYRVSMLKDIGLFDDDFFAYGEDIDISFRAQLAGWAIRYVPSAVVRHHIGATSKQIKGFTTYQTIKNFPWIIVKDVPTRLLPGILVRFSLAYVMFIGRAFARGQGWWAIKGFCKMLFLLPKKVGQRRKIQKTRRVTVEYINSIMTHDLPPNAHNLRKLRLVFQRSATRRK